MIQEYLTKLRALIYYLKTHKDITVLLIIGMFVLSGIDYFSSQKLEQEQQYHRTIIVQQLAGQLQSNLQSHISALTALNVVYQNFVDINHYDFQQYGQSITANNHGFRRLMYISPSKQVQRIYPMSWENKNLVGISLKATPAYNQLLTEATKRHEPVISNLIPFLGHRNAVLAITPIYRHSQEFLGYAVGEINIENIWDPLQRPEFLQKYSIQLIDAEGHGLFSSINFSPNEKVLTKFKFKIANQTWTLVMQPTQITSATVIFQRVMVWVFGLLILTLILTTVTRSRWYQYNLNRAQKQFEKIFHASPDGIAMLGSKLQFRLANPPIQTWSGLDEKAISNKTFFDVFTCQCPHLQKCRELSFLLCTSDKFDLDLPEVLETQVTHPETGVTRTLRLNASKVSPDDTTEEGNHFICLLGDISSSKELSRVKENFVATLTHDLKTPLIAQEMVLESMLSDKTGIVTPEQRKLLTGAVTSVKDLLDMVNSSLLYYQLESAHLTLQKQNCSLPDLIKEVMQTLSPLADDRQITLELQASLNLPSVMVDPINMKRVFHNLLANAIRYSNKNSNIRVDLHVAEADQIEISFINQGKGIPPAELPRIFDKYYTLSRKFKQIGTGLGLYIARRIVELHGGKMGVESEVDKETRFFIFLPIPQSVVQN